MSNQRMSDRIVADYLRDIGMGAIAEGAPLPAESAMGATYGVSRSVVREAIRTLGAKGFVIARQGSATVVAPRRLWHVLDSEFLAVNTGEVFFEYLQEARELIEPRIARLAAMRIQSEELDELERLQAEVERTPDPERHATLDLAFHQQIAAASGNPIVASMHSLISGLGFRTRALSAGTEGGIERASLWHRQILEALRAQDPDRAESEMRLHIRQVREELVSLGVPGLSEPTETPEQ
jgi:DNA-binding FadR family transcriptional regulator